MAIARNLDSLYKRQPPLGYHKVFLEKEQITRKLLKQIKETQSVIITLQNHYDNKIDNYI
jgi:hypothetical protein